ncbi:MAG: beta-ketoacyl-ACP synthase III [Zoogloeaceae bacterium]|jgi:3-oxoacyl-[acyl-carrier-protein] synthase-3|nr:beta-ketoacyl-ACP synthase III [Zoogloeaceae bacterium]
MNEVFITATAIALPNAPVGNEAVEAVLGKVGGLSSRARRIVLRQNGIKSRHYAIDPATGAPTHSNASLTAEAVRALGERGFALGDIRCLVTGTSLPDQLMPNHGVMVHGELGNPACEVVSTAGICLSGLTALKYAWLAVGAGDAANAVATGSEISSAILRAEHFASENAARAEALEKYPWIAFEKDFLRWMLSDGAGAFLLEPRPREGRINLRIDWIELSSAAHRLPVCMYAGGERESGGALRGWAGFSPRQWLEQSIFAVKQDVKLLDRHVVEATLEAPLRAIAARRGLVAGEIDWFLPHMSSYYFRQPIFDGLARAGVPVPFERWFTNLAARGNTGSASIYILIDELCRSGRLAPGNRLLCFVPESGRFSSGFLHLTVVCA